MPLEKTSSGVQELIDRLRDDGIEAGRREAETVLADARKQGREMLDAARSEAAGIVQAARADADRTRTAGEDALRVAARDTVLSVKSDLSTLFTNQVNQLVTKELHDHDFLRRLILEIADRVAPSESDKPVAEVLLPRDVIGLDELRRRPEAVKEGTLAHFVLTVADEMLRRGIEFRPSPTIEAGIKVRLVEEDVTIDMTDRTVGQLLLRHLLPRFRAIVEGIIH